MEDKNALLVSAQVESDDVVEWRVAITWSEPPLVPEEGPHAGQRIQRAYTVFLPVSVFHEACALIGAVREPARQLKNPVPVGRHETVEEAIECARTVFVVHTHEKGEGSTIALVTHSKVRAEAEAEAMQVDLKSCDEVQIDEMKIED